VASAGPFNFSALCNHGVAAARGATTHYLFLKPDTEAIAPGWLEHLLGYAQRSDVGIVGAMLISPEETIQHAGIVVGLNGSSDHVLKNHCFRASGRHRSGGPNGILLASRDVSAVTGACMLVRSEVFDQLGGFDEGLAVGHNDVDLCLRARALGYKVIQDAYAVLLSRCESNGRGFGRGDPHPDDPRSFLTRYGSVVFGGDPFYSPLLALDSTDMPLCPPAAPPRRLRWRTTRIILPRSMAESRSTRFDAASLSRPIIPSLMTSSSAGYGFRRP
jgi:hypothetical protein